MRQVDSPGSVIGGRQATGQLEVVARREGARGGGDRLSQNLTLVNSSIGDNVVMVSPTFAHLILANMNPLRPNQGL